MNHKLNSLVQQRKPEPFLTWWESQEKKPSQSDCLEGARLAKHPEVVAILVDHAMKREVSVEGWNDATAAALSGAIEHLELALERKADLSFETRGLTPLEQASKAGHLAFVRRLLAEGVDPNVESKTPWGAPQSPLSIAIAAGHAEVVDALLEKATPTAPALHMAVATGDVDLVRRFSETVPVDPKAAGYMQRAEMVPVLRELGWDPAEVPEAAWKPWFAGMVYRRRNAEERIAFFQALEEAGVRCDASAFGVMLQDGRFDPEVLDIVVRMGADPTAPVPLPGRKEPVSPMQLALEMCEIGVVQALAELGASVPASVRVEPDWDDYEEKRAWLAERNAEAPAAAPREFLDFTETSADELATQLSSHEGLFGVYPGMAVEEAEVLGFGLEAGHGQFGSGRQYLTVEARGGALRNLRYLRKLASREDRERASEALTARLGAPVGTEVPRWQSPHGVLKLKYCSRGNFGEIPEDALILTLEPGELRPSAEVTDVPAFGQMLSDHLSDISPDTMQNGVIVGAEVTAKANDVLQIALRLDGADAPLVIDWRDPPLDAEGNLDESLVDALLTEADRELSSRG